jgi:hypothetical protein
MTVNTPASHRQILHAPQSFLIAGRQMIRPCSPKRPARFTTHSGLSLNAQRRQRQLFLAMKNSIIFISTLSLVAMMLASCTSAFAPDETVTTGVTCQTNETRPERSAEDSVNSISGGAY